MNNLNKSLVFILATLILAGTTWKALSHMVTTKAQKSSLLESHTWAEELNLTADQKNKIMPMESKLKNDLVGVEKELAQAQMILCRELMMGEAKSLQNSQNKVNQWRNKKEELVVAHLIKLKQVLTPEQQKSLFASLMQEICQGCQQATGSKEDHCGMCTK